MLEGQDYAGALDLLEQLRGLLQQQQLAGLQCLRHLPARLQDVSASVDAALAAEFLGTVGNAADVGRLVAEAAAEADSHPGGCWRRGCLRTCTFMCEAGCCCRCEGSCCQQCWCDVPHAVVLYRSRACMHVCLNICIKF
jgi:hypothetical protein